MVGNGGSYDANLPQENRIFWEFINANTLHLDHRSHLPKSNPASKQLTASKSHLHLLRTVRVQREYCFIPIVHLGNQKPVTFANTVLLDTLKFGNMGLVLVVVVRLLVLF